MSYNSLFLQSLSVQKSSRSTISSLTSDLQHFSHFMGDRSLEHATPQDIQHYLKAQSHLASSTVARRLSSLRQFYAFLVREGAIAESPLSGIQHKSKSSSVSGEDIDRLLAGAKAWEGVEGKRLTALLHILSLSDISVNELVALPLKDVLQSEAVQEYLSVREHFLGQDKESPWLFPSSSQKGHLTRQRFGQLVKELVIKLGLDPTYVTLSKIRNGLKKVERNLP